MSDNAAVDEDEQTDVVIVGGSLVGLTTSLLLSRYGVRNVVVEKHRGTAIHPRAASFHQRTMEVFRHAGVQEIVEEAAAGEFVQNGAIVAVESLCGKELQYFYRSWNEGVEDLSATSRLFITQVGLEPLLRDAAAAAGATHLFGTQVLEVRQDADGVSTTVQPRDGGPSREIRSRYVVAADGAHSAVREQLGIAMPGHGTADCVTVYFGADMTDMIGERNLSVIYVLHPQMLGFFRFSFDRQSGFLSIFSVTDPVTGERFDLGADVPEERAVDWVRMALGCADDVAVRIDSIQHWEASADCAERFSDGRVFLAGDSAHTMPPTGGWGGNTGVADAHNLAWKLAMVVHGQADPRLLDSYDQERRPAALMTVEQAYSIYAGRYAERSSSSDEKPLAEPRPAEDIELGTVYRSGALLDPTATPYADGEEAATRDPRADGAPVGARVPHVELHGDGQDASTHDLAAHRFVLLTGRAGDGWHAAAATVGGETGLPLDDPRLPDADVERISAGLGLADDGALILRPDGVIAWRADGAAAPGEHEERLRAAMTRLLGHPAPVAV
ncbi:FAD-dependent monooxygenase [Microbacterium sp.]|uniref:FAD-dependent monooxygenase n=1 Tax=Microbacterium sp. TaxID=51671 RepID=UPI003A8F0799